MRRTIGKRRGRSRILGPGPALRGDGPAITSWHNPSAESAPGLDPKPGEQAYPPAGLQPQLTTGEHLDLATHGDGANGLMVLYITIGYLQIIER